MASPYEVELTLSSATDLKNVNWRYGALRPYAVVWLDPNNKFSTKVDEHGDEFPVWDQTLVIPFSGQIKDATLSIDVVHAGAEEDTKPLIGKARLDIRDVLDDVGFDDHVKRTLKLKRPSGRPQGKVEVKVLVREPPRYRAPEPYYAHPYGAPPPRYSDPYAQQAPAGYPYGAYNTPGYGQAPPMYGHGQESYGQAPPIYGQGQPMYGQGQDSYGGGQYGQKEEKKSKFGMGTGLAVGVAAGALGTLAIMEGVDQLEDNIADDVEERIEDNDAGYDDE